MDIIHIDGGCDEVVCDLCNNDYSESLENGGAIVNGWAYCPSCWRSARWHNPTGQIVLNNLLTPFAAFIQAMRKRAVVA